jgi:Tat protein secretion system quality control protein TatD with DNase activity
VVTKMAEAMNIPVEEIAKQTTFNAQKLFGS